MNLPAHLSPKAPGDAEIVRVRRFVILTSQRTGSTVLVKSLDSCPSIFCAGEIFHPGPNVYHKEFQFPHSTDGQSRVPRFLRRFVGGDRVRRHLRNFFELAGFGMNAVGFKLMTSHVKEFPAVLPALKELQCQFIVHYRDDSFATALSHCRARASGVFHSDRARPLEQRGQINIGEAEFRRTFERCRLRKQELLELKQQLGGTASTYEEMYADWDAFISKIGSVLGMPTLKASAAITKLKPGVNSIRFGNEDELRARFGGSG